MCCLGGRFLQAELVFLSQANHRGNFFPLSHNESITGGPRASTYGPGVQSTTVLCCTVLQMHQDQHTAAFLNLGINRWFITHTLCLFVFVPVCVNTLFAYITYKYYTTSAISWFLLVLLQIRVSFRAHKACRPYLSIALYIAFKFKVQKQTSPDFWKLWYALPWLLLGLSIFCFREDDIVYKSLP